MFQIRMTYDLLGHLPDLPSDCINTVCVIGFGGLEVACWPLVPKFAGSHPTEAVGFLGRKIPQHAFFRRGNKTVGPMS
jgi:hypothetical protein